MAAQLSRAGYGPADRILVMPSNLVIHLLEYEMFRVRLERVIYEMNKPESKK